MESNSSWSLVGNWENCSQGTHSPARYSPAPRDSRMSLPPVCSFGHQPVVPRMIPPKARSYQLLKFHLACHSLAFLSLGLGTRKCLRKYWLACALSFARDLLVSVAVLKHTCRSWWASGLFPISRFNTSESTPLFEDSYLRHFMA